MLKTGYKLIQQGNPNWEKICREDGISEKCINYLSIYDITETKEENIRKKQKNFRNELLKIWDYKCAITGVDESECDACHILPIESGGTYNSYNGILLSKSLHSSFDKGLWTISSKNNKIIKISNKNLTIDKYVGQTINLPAEMLDYLNWHNKFCLEKIE
jgi:predicted restriction endonuclease